MINGSEVSGFSHRFTIDADSSNAPSPTLLNFIPGAHDEKVPTSIGKVYIHFLSAYWPQVLIIQVLGYWMAMRF